MVKKDGGDKRFLWGNHISCASIYINIIAKCSLVVVLSSFGLYIVTLLLEEAPKQYPSAASRRCSSEFPQQLCTRCRRRFCLGTREPQLHLPCRGLHTVRYVHKGTREHEPVRTLCRETECWSGDVESSPWSQLGCIVATRCLSGTNHFSPGLHWQEEHSMRRQR